MEKKTIKLVFNLQSVTYEELDSLKKILTPLSQGDKAFCYLLNNSDNITIYDEDDTAFYEIADSEIREHLREEGLLLGIFGFNDHPEEESQEGLIVLHLNVYFGAEESVDKFENAIYHLQRLRIESLRRKGINVGSEVEAYEADKPKVDEIITTVFVKEGQKWVIAQGIPDNPSTNDILKVLGYEPNQYYSYFNNNIYRKTGSLRDTPTVCFKVMTDNIICVITNDGRINLTNEYLQNYLKDFDFKNEYNLYSMERDLDTAIFERNFSIQFVAEALELQYSPTDKMLHSHRYNYNFFFEDGYLVRYEISDGYNREAKELKQRNYNLFQAIELHAKKYHGNNDVAIINEINIQSKAMMNIPSMIKNPFLQEFQNYDGTYNYQMLLVTKYQNTQYEQKICYKDCKCICHNELHYEGIKEEGFDKYIIYKYRDYYLTFYENGEFYSVEYKQS